MLRAGGTKNLLCDRGDKGCNPCPSGADAR